MTHPAHVEPPATSKPVIVTNRSMIAADPMIAESAERAASVKKSIAVDDDKSEPQTSMPIKISNGGEKVIKPLSAEPSQPTTSTDQKHDTETDDEATTDTATHHESKLSSDEAIVKTDETKDTVETDAKIIEDTTSERPVETVGVVDESTEPETDEIVDKEVADLEAMITKGTYRLPIGQVKHRRERIVFGICLTLALILVTLNVLLDVGMLSIAGVPHTNFFN